jgi:hypothetical protein
VKLPWPAQVLKANAKKNGRTRDRNFEKMDMRARKEIETSHNFHEQEHGKNSHRPEGLF